MCQISIISPVYNMEKYLEECIKSILSQDFEDFEVLFVNDGSKDSSFDILRHYENIDKRIKVFNKKNEGQGVARNFVLPYAKGKYVLYLDPDDWLCEGALRKIFNKFQQDDYDVIFFNVYRFYQKSGNKNPFRFIDCFYTRFKDSVFNYKTASDILFETNGLPFKAYNREFLVKNKIKYTASKYIEDSEFFIRAVLAAKKLVCLDEFIVNYRVHSESSSSTTHLNIDVFEKTFYICESVFMEYYNKNPDKNLLDSFLKNRTDQLFCHFNRVIKSHKRQFYQMMRRIFIHINRTYSMDYLSKTAYKSQVERIIKYDYYTELFLRKIRSCSCLLPCYFEI